MKVLVTGGAGFIGSNLVDGLLSKGYDVKIIDNLMTGRIENISKYLKHIEFIEGDIRDNDTITKVVKNVETIYHLAAIPSVPYTIKNPIETNEIHINGTLNILDASIKNNVKRIIFASSSSVYGDSLILPKREDMIPNPLSHYAVSKLAGENYMNVYSKLFGLETISLRYFNVFGPSQDPTSEYSAVIPKFIKAMQNDIRPTIFGDGLQTRDFTYVQNVVDANILASQTSFDKPLVMNCATNCKISLIELVDSINKILNKSVIPIFDKPQLGDIKHSYADTRLIEQRLKFFPIVNFNDGILRTINHFIDN